MEPNKEQQGYTVRDCNLLDWFTRYGIQEGVVQQVRHHYEPHLTNYAYPVLFWELHRPKIDSHTIAIFRVRRRNETNNQTPNI